MINQVYDYVRVANQTGNTQNFMTHNACFFTYYNCFQGTNDFLDNEKELITIHEVGKTWCGYIFFINDKKVFWGVDSSYRNCLNEQFNNINPKYKKDLWETNLENRKKEIFDFFSKNGIESKPDINDDISVGNDGYILLK